MIRRLVSTRPAQGALVLNARRHRDGDQAHMAACAAPWSTCSTPGGIETVISSQSPQPSRMMLWCSTPGGIETVISPTGRPRRRPRSRVLNARRHRDGDQHRRVSSDRRLPSVLNARRHRDGDQGDVEDDANSNSLCSTPGGIETVIRQTLPYARRVSLRCSTPGGIETVIREQAWFMPRAARRCSTPGGIETVISCGAG